MAINIKHVICPIDLSTHSALALRHAAAWAQWYDAWLHVLHVAPLPQPILGPTGLMATLPARPLDEIKPEVERFVTDTLAGNDDRIVDVVQGQPAAAIVDATAREHSLLVMGTHGWSGLDRLLLGSVTERVAHATHCPLLVVPPHTSSLQATPTMTQMLCAVDFRPSSLAGLRYGLSLAQEAKARVEVVTVLEHQRGDDLGALVETMVPEHEDLRRARLQQLHERIPDDARLWCEIQENVLAGPPADALLRRSEALEADLIVMGTGDRPHLHALWLGSTTGRLLREARCPVLIVPGPERHIATREATVTPVGVGVAKA
jgi:nucleotide-binding universal stress UspA family protein